MVTSGANTPPFDFDASTRDEIALYLAEAAVAAGPAVMELYESGCEVVAKSDGSPVTLADRRAEALICERLARAVPDLPMVAENRRPPENLLRSARDFFSSIRSTARGVRRAHGEFRINIALIEKGSPSAGAVYAPARGRLWLAGDHAYVCDAPVAAGLPHGVARRRIRTRSAPGALVALASRSHGDPRTEAFLGKLSIAERRSAGSSLKFCLIAEGLADVYPRFAPTMEWDTAAADAVLRAAGGVVLDVSGKPLVYGKIDHELRNGGFVAWGDAAAARRFGHR